MEAIDAIEKGRMWMNIRRVMDWAPEYRTLLDEVFDEFEARMPGFKTFKRNLGVLISSPNANVFYHADIQGQSLWQIEGIKRVYIYPRSEVFITPKSVEKILLRETAEDMPYENWFDDYATHVDLQARRDGDLAALCAAPRPEPRLPEHLGDDGALDEADLELLRGPLRQRRAAPDARPARTARRATTACTSIRRPARRSLWKKLGKQITGDVVKQRDFRIDAKSPNGRASLR